MTTKKKDTQTRAGDAPPKKKRATGSKAAGRTSSERPKKKRSKAAAKQTGEAPRDKKTSNRGQRTAPRKRRSSKTTGNPTGSDAQNKKRDNPTGSDAQNKKRDNPTGDAARSKPSPQSDAPRPPAPATPATAASTGRASPSEHLDPEVAEQIRALEARLGGMISESADAEPPPSLREQVTFAAREVVDRLAAPVERPGQDDGGVVDAVRGLLSSDYYLRQWGRLGMRNRSEEVDDFGLDPVYEQRLRPLWDFLYKRYFRVEAEGAEKVPDSGRCLIVANHSGTIPLDGLMLRACLRLEHPSGRELRWLAEDFIYHLPFVGAFMSRVGAVRACQENAQRLLGKESLVAVFPEGVKGIGKLYRDRYKLQRFGRGGFIRLCLRMGAPIVPCAVIGAEESSPMLYRDEFLSRALGLPYLPVTPTFPWLGPAGLIPAPTKWKIAFGELMDFSEYGPSAAEDNVLVGRLAERVRTTIQRTLDRALSERHSVWTG